MLTLSFLHLCEEDEKKKLITNLAMQFVMKMLRLVF